MATHFSILAWRIPGPEEPGGLPSTGLHRVGHDWSDLAAAAASVGDVGSIPGSGRSSGGGNGNPLQYSCLGNPMGLQWVGPELVTKQVASLGHLFLLLQISSPDVFTSMLFILCVPHHLDGMFVEKLTLKPGTLGAAGRVRDQIWPWGPVGSQRSWGSLNWGEFFGFTVHPSDSLPSAKGYGCFLFSISHLAAMWCSGSLAQILRNKEEIHIFILTTPLAGVT